VNNKIKIGFFDIDWTLYDHKLKGWSRSAISSLQSLSDRGFKVIICSARPYHSMKAFGVFDQGVKWDGFISSAGAVSFADGKYLRKVLINQKEIKPFLDFTKKKHATCELVEVEDRKLAFPLTEEAKNFYSVYTEVVPSIVPYEGEEVVGFNLFVGKELDEKYVKAFPHLLFSRYFDYAVDVYSHPHLKGDGVESVLAHYGFSKEEAIGFGDDYQDISMAEHLGNFVCMGQGVDDLKNVASFVSSPVGEDGVYNGLKHFDLV